MAPLDPETLGRLYRQHAPALRLYARQWPDADEDLVQEAFVRLAQQAAPPEQPIPWLYRVVRNGALARSRNGTRRQRREQQVSRPEAWFDAPADALAAQEAARLLAELPLELREVIVARLWGGLTFAEIAPLVGCALPTAQRRYQQGLAALRERLQGRWKHHNPTI